MTHHKIAVVYGTRPEAIKLGPVIKAARSSEALDVVVLCTGQHDELLRNADAAFGKRPDLDLGLMRDSQTPVEFVARALQAINAFLSSLSPEMLLVQGDTASAFAATVVGFQRGIPIGHVEAGLRTRDLGAPFPEEGYRQMIDRVATRLYAPSRAAARELLAEGRKSEDILVTGNTGIDAVLAIAASTLGRSCGEPPFVLATLHRREALGEPLRRTCRALRRVASEGLRVVLPVHKNPAVRSIVRELLGNAPGVYLCEPLSYPDLVRTMLDAVCLVTDSGGLQEEAPTLGVPVLVARETTERPEAVEAGSALLVGSDEDRIVAEVLRLGRDTNARAAMAVPRSLFGDGNAAARIVADVIANVTCRAGRQNLIKRQPAATNSAR
jgi:UDP-N-acetylglucosamine 2-epimerase (non-hydrolysing)